MDKITTLQNPDPVTAANHIINGVLSDKLITMQVRCTVNYDGRASSNIEEGDRILIAKPDGTLLVHGDENYQPINWQSSGAEISADITQDEQLLVTGETDEYLGITCTEIYQITLFNNKDNAELRLKGTEEEMHNRIVSNPDIVEDGLTNIVNEKQFAFGRVDIFGNDAEGNTVIIEVKRRPATRDHAYQLYTYLMEYEKQEKDTNETVRGILVAPNCTDYIHEILDDLGLEYIPMQTS